MSKEVHDTIPSPPPFDSDPPLDTIKENQIPEIPKDGKIPEINTTSGSGFCLLLS